MIVVRCPVNKVTRQLALTLDRDHKRIKSLPSRHFLFALRIIAS